MTQASTITHDEGVTPDRLAALARRSVEVIRAGQARSGAYVASPAFPVYRYCWFRDGSFIADAMSRAGEVESAEAFFAWCVRVLEARSERIDSLVARKRRGEPVPREELLHCRYTLDGDEAGEDWWNFQLDGYGTWLWALAEHSRRHDRPTAAFEEAIRLTIDYLDAFWQEPSYDWWEEHVDQRHTSTLAAVYAGLDAFGATSAEAVARTIRQDGVAGGRLVKWVGGDSIDASLVACATPFRVFAPDEPVMAATVEALEQVIAHRGVHRYPDDTYYGGGEWLLLAALLGWHYAEVGRTDDAWRQLAWVAAQATEAGDMPEQVDGCLLAPGARQEWVERWGDVATPLLWSHAMFLTLALELGAVPARR